MSTSSVYSSDGGLQKLSIPGCRWSTVCLLPSSGIRSTIINTFVKDTSVFLIVMHSARYLSRMRACGVQSLLDTIVGDATVYFLIFTVHILVILFEFFAPVSDHLIGSFSSTHYKLDIANYSRPSSTVSRYLKCHNNDELDGMLSYL